MRLAACQRARDVDVISRAPCDHDDVTSGSGDGELTASCARVYILDLEFDQIDLLKLMYGPV